MKWIGGLKYRDRNEENIRIIKNIDIFDNI